MADSSTKREIEVPAKIDDLKYMQASNVNVSNYVSVKLSSQQNYEIWKAQMVCLLESQQMRGIVEFQYDKPDTKSAKITRQYNKLVKGWIFGSLSEAVLKNVVQFESAHDVWKELKSFYDPSISSATADLERLQQQWQKKEKNESLPQRDEQKTGVDSTGNLNSNQQIIDLETGKESKPEPEPKQKTLLESTIEGSWRKVNATQKAHKDALIDPLISCTTADLGVDSSGNLNSNEQVTDPEAGKEPEPKPKINLPESTIEGSWRKVNATLKAHKDKEVEFENGNTVLHLAVEKHKNSIVEKLLESMDGKDIEKKNSHGQTALHVAVKVGNLYAAKLLIEKRQHLLTILDQKAHSPLLLAYNNMKLEMYVYLLEANTASSYKLDVLPSTYQQNAVELIVTAIIMKRYDLATKLLNEYNFLAKANASILMAIAISFPTDLGFWEALIYPSSDDVWKKIKEQSSKTLESYDVLYKWAEAIIWNMRNCRNTSYSWLPKIVLILFAPIAILYLIYRLIRFLVIVLLQSFSTVYFLFWTYVASKVSPFKEIQKKKNQYKEAKDILSLICTQMERSNSHYSGPLLEAVRKGAYEVVKEILDKSPDAIYSKNEEGHNVIQLAVINRSEEVYDLIYQDSYRTMTDSSKNNLVHLAGRLAPSFVLSRTTGAALQLQQELQWLEKVKKPMLPTELIKENIYKETPEMVFTREHKDLVKEGEKWMKTTAESSSITAALIVTIVFAAAITVPGGSNQDTGIPIFKKETAFTIFAIFDAISLFTATAALLVFLSVLTTRFSEKDFLVSLPRRLIFGLCALIVSTATMIVAFGAILFLVFGDHKPWIWAPIIVGACLPIGVIVFLQIPLVADLWVSTYIHIFGKQN